MYLNNKSMFVVSGGPEPGGAVTSAAGGAHLQGMHGQGGVHRLHTLRAPGGVLRLRCQSE